MFVRFVLQNVDSESHRKAGLLTAAAELRDDGVLDPQQHQSVVELRAWFIEHLRNPKILNQVEHARALSWFKSSAHKPISRMWELAAVLEAHGLHVELLKTSDPGIIIYEDKWQVAAKPRKGQRHPW